MRGLHDAVGVVHHDHAARAAHRARCRQRLHVGLGVEHACREDRSRRAAGPEHLQVAALGHAPGQLHDHVAKGLAELDLVYARLVDVAADRHQPRARRLVGPELRVGGAAVVDDPRHGREGLDVVQQRRPPPCALHSGEWGTGSRLGALAFERLEQRRLLAADVGAVAAVEPDVEWVVLAHRLGARVALGPSLFDGLGKHPVGLVVLAADVDPGLVGADRISRDEDAFDQHVR